MVLQLFGTPAAGEKEEAEEEEALVVDGLACGRGRLFLLFRKSVNMML